MRSVQSVKKFSRSVTGRDPCRPQCGGGVSPSAPCLAPRAPLDALRAGYPGLLLDALRSSLLSPFLYSTARCAPLVPLI